MGFETTCAHVLLVTDDVIARCGRAASLEPGDAPLCPEHEVGEVRGAVYLIQWGDYVKIGQSLNPEQRLRQIGKDATIRPPDTIGSPSLIGQVPGGAAVESWLHVALADYRGPGEWFRNEGHVAELVKHAATRLQTAPRYHPPVPTNRRSSDDVAVDF